MVRPLVCLLFLLAGSVNAATNADAIRDKGSLYLDLGYSLGGSYSLEYEKPIAKYASVMLGFEYGTYGVDMPKGTHEFMFIEFDTLKEGYKVKVVNNKIDIWLLFNMKSGSKWHLGYPVGLGVANYTLNGDLTLTTDSLGALKGSYRTSGMGLQGMFTLLTLNPVPHLALAVGAKAFVAKLTVPDRVIFSSSRGTNIQEVPAKFVGKRFNLPYPEVFVRLGYVF